MSTKSSIYYAEDAAGFACHIYWEYAERTGKEGRMTGAPIYLSFVDTKTANSIPIRLVPETAQQILAALGKTPDLDIL